MTQETRINEVSNFAALESIICGIKLIAFDFDGVFTDNSVYVCENGTESVRCWRGDGLGLRKLDKISVDTIIISTETNPVVSARSQKLGIRCIQSCEDKLTALNNVAQELSISFEQTAFVGNDINDLPCLKAVALPIVVQDAHHDVIACAKYITRRRGGQGAVREICDIFESIRM
jgi:3-deoxy-D-manno-octulosonate 8-phosphate phosphatase (KDO 8-P phosphatase)